MANQDAHTGGSLSDMAPTGTSIPGDAGEYRKLKSVPRPDQLDSGLGAADLANAAGDGADVPRSHRDAGATGEVITGTGDQLPAAVESKRLHFDANQPQAKGHDRFGKHVKQRSEFDRLAGGDAQVEAAPGEEEDGQDEIRGKRADLRM